MAFTFIRNLWRTATAGTPSSQKPQFPVEDTQIDSRLMGWRTRYGVGTGNGKFVVTEVAATGNNVVSNGGFDPDLTGWTAYGTPPTLASVAGGYGGGNCCQITSNGSQTGGPGRVLELTVGKTYRIVAWVKSGTSGNEAFQLQANPGSGYVVVASTTSSADWQSVTGFFTPTSVTVPIFLRKAAATAGTMLVDQCSVYEMTGDQYICFDEGGAEMIATIAAGTYNGQTLAAAVKAALDAVGGTYTVAYDEPSAKFTVARAAGNFTLRWSSGTRRAIDASAILGFDAAADDTGDDEYTADSRRVHYPSEDTGWFDLGAAAEIDFIAILGHNILAGATITLYCADDDAGTNLDSVTPPWQVGDIYYSFAGAAKTKRFWKLTIADPANTGSYIEIKTIGLGKIFTPNRGPAADDSDGYDDPSEVERSEAMVSYSTSRPTLRLWDLPFRGLNDSTAAFIRALTEDVGKKHGFFICFDIASEHLYSHFVQFADSPPRPTRQYYNHWEWSAPLVEVK